MKKLNVLILTLFLLTPTLWLGAYVFHPKVRVGIVMVDDCGEHFGMIAKNGFKNYEDYFEAKIIPETFDASNVRVENGAYLNNDFFTQGETSRLRREYDVDVILFVTEHPIQDWDQDGLGVWGEANTKSASAIMTVLHFNDGTPENKMVIEHIALHEVFHLLGYTHNQFDRSGIMQYASNPFSRKLCPFYELQLPIRVCVFKLGLGQTFVRATLITTSAFALTFLPLYAASEILLFRFFNSLKGAKKQTRIMIFLGIAEAFILLIMMGSIVWLIIPVAIQLYFHAFVHFFSKINRKPLPAGK